MLPKVFSAPGRRREAERRTKLLTTTLSGRVLLGARKWDGKGYWIFAERERWRRRRERKRERERERERERGERERERERERGREREKMKEERGVQMMNCGGLANAQSWGEGPNSFARRRFSKFFNFPVSSGQVSSRPRKSQFL